MSGFLRKFARAGMVIAVALVAFSGQNIARAQDAYAKLRAQDLRLQTIAERLMIANSALCEDRTRSTGMVIHSRDQYPQPPAGWFSGGTIAVAAIVPGSTADRAGILPDDVILSANGIDMSTLTAAGDTPGRDRAFEILAIPVEQNPLELLVRRADQTFGSVLDAPAACRVLVEIVSSDETIARTDGKVLQISSALARSVADDELAVIVAHELAHVVLAHRRRLRSAGVSKGLLGELGRNQQLNRQVEVEADLLSVHLLANAGYDPRLAEVFWRSDAGRRAGGGILPSTTYPSASARGDLVAREITDFLPFGAHPTMPMHLLRLRDISFTEM